MHAASQLLDGGSMMWMTLLNLHVNLNANDDDGTQKNCFNETVLFSTQNIC